MLRVGFDVTALLVGNTGVARYVRELGLAVERRDVEVIRFAIGRGDHRGELPPGTRATRVPLRVVHRSWAHAGPPSAERLAPGSDVVHTPDLVPPPTRRPLVLTVHDLVALERPDLHPPRSVAAQQQQFRAARDHAAVVICVSQSTADAVCSAGLDRSRVVVVPNGVTQLPPPERSVTPAGPYLLAVGSLSPRKGLSTLVAAFAHATVPADLRLVLAGPPGWDAASVRRAIEDHKVGERVTCTGPVSDAQLSGLYAGRVAVCASSLAEGFGLPVLEAGAAGAAVIASDIPVFRELAGAVALYAAPGDLHAWTDALERIVDDEALRRESAMRGRTTAHTYTWERTAALTVAAYERALEAA